VELCHTLHLENTGTGSTDMFLREEHDKGLISQAIHVLTIYHLLECLPYSS
jgi:hypothetical protein